MKRQGGFTLVELLIVLAIVALLATLIIPTFSRVLNLAEQATCSGNMRSVHVAIVNYATCNQRRLPPFALSGWSADLPTSGHWGGAAQSSDPAGFGRRGVEWVNLWALVRDGSVSVDALKCPGSPGGVREGKASYFKHTTRFSTYCLRMPYSRDVFRRSPQLADRGGSLMGIYGQASGGQRVRVAAEYVTVPQLSLDRIYRISGSQREFSPACDALMSDTFWWRKRSEPAGSDGAAVAYPIRAGWCHEAEFNVLFGDGSVRRRTDDGTVNSIADASYGSVDSASVAGERVWEFFETGR
ncbi:MAG: type II secretion system protein [Phycisphaerae bacterium]